MKATAGVQNEKKIKANMIYLTQFSINYFVMTIPSDTSLGVGRRHWLVPTFLLDQPFKALLHGR